MRDLIISAALFALLGAGSAAAERLCTGESRPGALKGVSVDIRVDDRGRELSRSVRWGIEPDAGKIGWPIVGLNYELQGTTLGALTDITLMHIVLLEPAPKSNAAEIRVQVDGGGDWRRGWGMYTEMMREYRAGRSTPVAIMGAVPLAFTGERAENTDLIDAVGAGRAMEVSVIGDADAENLGGGRYTLTTASRDSELAKALAEAEAAARNWRRCEVVR